MCIMSPCGFFAVLFKDPPKLDIPKCPNCGVKLHIDLYNHVLFCPKCYYEMPL